MSLRNYARAQSTELISQRQEDLISALMFWHPYFCFKKTESRNGLHPNFLSIRPMLASSNWVLCFGDSPPEMPMSMLRGTIVSFFPCFLTEINKGVLKVTFDLLLDALQHIVRTVALVPFEHYQDKEKESQNNSLGEDNVQECRDLIVG